MGEFRKIAEEIAALVAESERGVDPTELAEIGGRVVTAAVQEPCINCYPGTPCDACCDFALFLSLSAQVYARKRRGHPHLSFAEAIEKLVAHMTGKCSGITRHAVLLTDSWDADAWAKWHNTINNIRQHATVEIYLMTGGRSVVEILP